WSGAGSTIRIPFRQVPLREPRSTRSACPFVPSIFAWTRESVRSASGMSFVDERPSVRTDRSSRIRRGGSPGTRTLSTSTTGESTKAGSAHLRGILTGSHGSPSGRAGEPDEREDPPPAPRDHGALRVREHLEDAFD